ncbi:hypothetical protein LPJ59_006224 [Coemansia sp. RSA 2399]|nr:hypothetical protein LPJ59_006224 [Coemansia sp. RSA 2399]
MSVHIGRLKVRYHDALVSLLAQLSPALYDLGISDISQSGILDVLCLGAVVPGVKSLSLGFADNIARWWTAERNDHDSAMQLAAHSSFTAKPLTKLSQLRVKNYPHNMSSCLAFLVRGQSLDYVYIETSRISTIERLDVSAIGLRIRSFSLACIGNVHTSEERAEKVISKVLSESSACFEYLRISVSLQHGVKFTPNPDLLLLPSLRSLTLRVPISLDRVAAVVAQIPRLRMLKAPYISTTTVAPDAPHTIEALWASLHQRSLPVISTSLEQVTLGFWDYQYNTRQLCCLILGFVARIPSILTLVHDPGFAPTLKWTKDCLVVLADSLGGLFGQIPDHMHDLVIADHQKNIY